jgi:hypothetical protein
MWHAREIREMHAKFWWENLKERDHLEEVDTVGKIIIKLISKNQNGCELNNQDRYIQQQSLVSIVFNMLAQ